MKQRNCEICNKPIAIGYMPQRAHMDKHVREGVVTKRKAKTETGEPTYPQVKFTWWGYVLTADRKLVTVASFTAPHSSITVDRYKIEGIPIPGEAVKITYQSPKDVGKTSMEYGVWFAKPLGYKATWIRIPAIYDKSPY